MKRFLVWLLVLTAVILAGNLRASAETPTSPPGTYYTSWLGNTFMDNNGHKRVTEEMVDICVSPSPNSHVFSAGYAETWGGGAEFDATTGAFIAGYDRFNSGFGDPVAAVAADSNYVYWGTGSVGLLRAPHNGDWNYVTYLPNTAIEGLYIKSGKLYISDYTNNKIRVFDTATMTEIRNWNCPNPTRLTVDNAGKVWVVTWSSSSLMDPLTGPLWFGSKVVSFSSTGVPGAQITDFDSPQSVAVNNSGQLLVGGLNANGQIWIYNITGAPTKVGSFGDLGGIFGGVAGAFTNTPKLHMVRSIAVDASGNIYTGCCYGTFWGTGIEKWTSSGTLIWRNFAGTSLDNAGIDPDNDTEVYSKYHHYSLDYSKTTPGTEWSLKGFTVNRFKYPNDNRVNHLSDVVERSLGAGAFRIGGKLFMARSSQNGYMCEFYRQETTTDGEVLVPSVKMAAGTDLDNQFYNPMNKTWIAKPKKDSLYVYGSWGVSKNGDLCTVTDQGKFVQYKFTGFDAYDNPNWDAATAITYGVPSEVADLSRVYYDSDADAMYMACDYPRDSDGNIDYGTFIHVKRFPNWSTGNRTSSYTATLPYKDLQYTPDTNYGGGAATSWSIAGDYIFVIYGYGHIRILNKMTGALVGTLVQNVNGWSGSGGQVDARFGMTAYKRSNGEYVILFENAAWANIMMIRWNPGSGVPDVPPVPTGLTAMAGNARAVLNWNASTGATSYTIKRSTASGGPYATVATVTGTTYTNAGLTNGTRYYYVVAAVNSAGSSGNSAQVSAVPVAVSLIGSGASANNSGLVNLTSAGTQDWVHWGLNSGADVNRRSGANKISGLTVLGGGSLNNNGDNSPTFSWTNGAPTGTITGTGGGVFTGAGANSGVQFTVPAGTAQRTLKVWVYGWSGSGRLTATLNEATPITYTNNTVWPDRGDGGYYALYTLTFKASAAGKMITVKWTIDNDNGGAVAGIQATALQ